MGAPLRRSARLLKSESSVPVARDLDVEMVNGEDGPVEQQRSDTRSSVSHSSVSQDPTTAPSPKPELGESTDDDDEEPVNHHVRSNRSDRRQVPRSTNPATQPIKRAERDATSPQRSSVPQLVPEPSRKRKTSDRPVDTDSDTDYEDYQGLSPPGQDESESDFGLESPQHTRKSTRPRRGKKIHDTLQDDSDGLIHPRPVLKRPRRKHRNNANMTTDHGDETLHAHPHDHAHGHTSDHGHDHDHSSEHTQNYGTHQDGFSPASGHGRHRHHQHGHHNSPRVHNHHDQRPYRKEHQLRDSISVPGLRTMLLENRWENSKIDPSVMIARRPAICIKFGLKPAEKTEDSSQTERDTAQDELDYDGSLILSSHDQKRVKEILDILLVYLRQNNDDDGDYDDGDYDDDDYDDDSLEDRVLSQLKEEEVDMFLQYLEEAGLSMEDALEDALEDSFVGLDGRETGDQKQPDTATRLSTAKVQPRAFKDDAADTSQAPHGLRSAVHLKNGGMVEPKARASRIKKPISRAASQHAPRNFVTCDGLYKPETPEKLKALCKTRGIDTTIVKVGAEGVTKKQANKKEMIELLKAWDYADAGVEPVKSGRKKFSCDCSRKNKYCIHDASGEINPIKLEHQPKFPCKGCAHPLFTEDDFVRPKSQRDLKPVKKDTCNYCALMKNKQNAAYKEIIMNFLRERLTKARAAEGDDRPVTDAEITTRPEGLGSRTPWASTWLCDWCGRRVAPERWKLDHATRDLCDAYQVRQEDKVTRREEKGITLQDMEAQRRLRCQRCDVLTRVPLINKYHSTPEACAEWRVLWENIRAITAQKSIPAVPRADKRMCDRCKEWHILSNGDHHAHLEECKNSGLYLFCPQCRTSYHRDRATEHTAECEPKDPLIFCTNCKGAYANIENHQREGCQPAKICVNCTRRFSLEDHRTHTCQYSKCNSCGKPRILTNQLAEHVTTCRTRYCSRCDCYVDREVYEVHFHACPIRRHAACLQRFHFNEMEEHLRSCEKRKCKHCRVRMTKTQLQTHLNTCDKATCGGCHVQMTKTQLDNHLCDIVRCEGCGVRMTREASREHHCGCYMCRCCKTGIPRVEFPKHYAECSQKLELRRKAQLSEGHCSWLYSHKSRLCHSSPWEGLDVCASHAKLRTSQKANTIAEKSRLRGKLFSTALRRKILQRMKRLDCFNEILNFIELWEKRPEEVMVIDTELINAKNLSSQHVFQISIKNAKNEPIVPLTVIRHDIPKSELYRLLNIQEQGEWKMPAYTFRKFQGEPDDTLAYGVDPNKSASWATVAENIAAYLQAKGINGFKACIDWSGSFLDYRALKAGLESANRVELLPPHPGNDPSTTFHPLYWWRIFKRIANLDTEPKLRLSLGNLFSILFPGQKLLLSRAHSADADVEMLIQIVKFFVDFCSGRDYKGPIERYFKPQDEELAPEGQERDIEADEAMILRSGEETERTEDDLDDSSEPKDDDALSADDDDSMNSEEEMQEDCVNELNSKSDEELRHLLEDEGLNVDGKTNDLIERLLDHKDSMQDQLANPSADLNPETFDPAAFSGFDQ